MLIADIMRRDPIKVRPDTAFKSLLGLHDALSPFQIHVVDEADRLLGVISAYDLIRMVIPEYMLNGLADNLGGVIGDDLALVRKRVRSHQAKTAADIMSTDVEFLRPDDPCLKANVLIVERKYNSMPVLDESGTLLGELTRRDVLVHLARHALNGD